MSKKLRITVEGKAYDVTVEVIGEDTSAPFRPAPVASVPMAASAPISAPVAAPKSGAAKPAAGAGDIPSPLAGKVVAVNVTVGQKVAAGDLVVTLEAMKMNTMVTAPSNGTVTAIKVASGDAVEEGQALLSLN
ncbi:MAG: biotin/lipoyl-containing protein [Verrucomicrobiota bacterium]|nr:biotin/lipoyl-containing protein [Verrucomicrobiota bacterium]